MSLVFTIKPISAFDGGRYFALASVETRSDDGARDGLRLLLRRFGRVYWRVKAAARKGMRVAGSQPLAIFLGIARSGGENQNLTDQVSTRPQEMLEEIL